MQTAGATLEKDARLIGEWTGFCSADINDTSEEENKFITYNQFNVLISEALKDYTKNVVLEESQSKQDKLIQKLQSNMINESTEEATSLHVEDASDLPAVLSVKGNHYQETQEGTSNLAVLNEGSVTQGGITVDIENGNIKVNGTNTTTEILIFNVGTVVLIKGETYYIKRLGTVNNTGIYLNNSGTQVWGQNTETSFEAKETGIFNVFLTAGTTQINNTTQQFLVSKTSGANWEEGKAAMPSLYYPSEISTVKDNIKIIQCNSNFLKKQDITEVSGNGITGKILEDGSIVLNGTTQYATYVQIAGDLQIGRLATGQNFKKYVLPKGSYKFNCQVSGQASDNNLSAYIRNSVGPSDFSQTLNRLPENSFKEIEFTTDKKEYVAYLWINSGITLTDFTLKFMLKRADDNSDYVQNEQKEYNLAVQQEMLKNDKFNLLSNKEMQTWKKTVLTGAENWQQSSVYNDVFYLVINDMMSDINKAQLISNQYKYEGYITDTADMQNNKCYTYKQYSVTNNKAVYVKNNNYTTLESFKAALAEKNMTLYYVTTTEELDLTEEQKEVLQQLNNLDLYKGTNNIYTDQDLALLQLDYTVDTKMYIDNKIANLKEQVNTTNELLSTTGTSAMLLDNLQNDLESEVM